MRENCDWCSYDSVELGLGKVIRGLGPFCTELAIYLREWLVKQRVARAACVRCTVLSMEVRLYNNVCYLWVAEKGLYVSGTDAFLLFVSLLRLSGGDEELPSYMRAMILLFIEGGRTLYLGC